MRFDGQRTVSGARDVVWEALHDADVLRQVMPGCESMRPISHGTYAATMAACVGPVRDTYRGTFSIDDVRDGHELRVRVRARGRCGRLHLDLRVRLSDAPRATGTTLTYVADAAVGGMVSRLAGAAMHVFGNQFTGCFFQGLERVVRRRERARLLVLT